MSIKPEQAKANQDEFEAAFAEEVQPAAEPSEEQAFGLDLPGDGIDSSPTEDGVVDAAGNAEKPAEPAADAPVDAPADEPPADLPADPEASATPAEDGAGDQPAGEVDIAKEIQRLKSWEGRLKAQEGKLKTPAKADEPPVEPGADEPAADAPAGEGDAAAADAIEKVAETTDDPALAAKADDLAEKVEDGTITAAQAMAQLTEDFGEDFVKMIKAIASEEAKTIAAKAAGEGVGSLKQTVDDIISDIRDSKTREHFKAIKAAHPDFNEVGASEEFKGFLAGLPDPDREDARRIVEHGSAEEIIGLLGSYKSSTGKQEEKPEEPAGDGQSVETPEAPADDIVNDDELDAAQGIRSSGTSGMALPAQPGSSEDYASAWEGA